MANVKVVIDVDSGAVTFAGDKVLTLTQQVKLLKQELQKVPEGTAEWTLLQQKFNETKDNLDRVNVKSKELFGTFSSLPGPIGAVAGQLDNTVGVLKTFSSLKFSDIKTQFVELGKDLSAVASNIGRLTGITAAYTIVARGLSSAFQAVGVSAATATVAARAFSAALTATGIGIIVVAVGYLIDKVMSLGDAYKAASDKAIQAGKDMEGMVSTLGSYYDLQTKKEVARAQAAGKSEDEIVKIKKDGLDKQIKNEQQALSLLEAERKERYRIANKGFEMNEEEKYAIDKDINDRRTKLELKIAGLKFEQENLILENIKAKRKELGEIEEKNAAKTAERIEKEKQQRLKDLAEIDKNAKEATNSLLTEREEARQKITDSYAVQIALAKKYGKDTYVLEEAQRNAQKELADKYAQEDKDKADKIAEERIRANQAAFEYQRKQFEELADLDRQRADNVRLQNDVITQSWISLGNNIASVLGSLANTFSGNETLQKIFAVTQVAVNTASSIGSILLNGRTQQAEYNTAIAAGNKTIAIAAANAFIPGMQVLAAGQFASGTAAVSAATAGKVASKINTGVQVGAAAAIGAAQIYAILSAKKSVSASSSDSGGGASTPAFTAPSIGAPQIGATSAQSGTIAGIAAGTMAANQSTDRPLKAYVVGNDITTEQQLQRRLRTMARLGG